MEAEEEEEEEEAAALAAARPRRNDRGICRHPRFPASRCVPFSSFLLLQASVFANRSFPVLGMHESLDRGDKSRESDKLSILAAAAAAAADLAPRRRLIDKNVWEALAEADKSRIRTINQEKRRKWKKN